MNTKQIRESIQQVVLEQLDVKIAESGFVRRKGTFAYKSKKRDSIQQIPFKITFNPPYEPAARAHINPFFEVQYPEVREKALELIAGNSFAFSRLPEMVIGQTLGNCSASSRLELWFLKCEDDYETLTEQIGEFFCDWILPLSEEISTVKGYVEAFESNDHRILWSRDRYIYTVAAYLLLGKLEKAKNVMEKNFGATYLRSQYSSVFEKLK